ncbi:hypothetical protein [uncultured Acetatifactor sp.]|nr:hypothetical protein [uncultured Acetatifactor sp.]
MLKTGNKMTDVILNGKISLAKSRDITVRADAHWGSIRAGFDRESERGSG